MPNPTDKKKIAIIGNGTVGHAQYLLMVEKGLDDVYTVDLNPKTGPSYTSLRDLTTYQGPMDVYCILVWRQSEIEEVINEIANLELPTLPLISIESTVMPGTYQYAKNRLDDMPVIIFPERIYPNDDRHGIFNQRRVMGGEYYIGRPFWVRYMIYENIVTTDNILAAELSHVLDNTWRYLEIAMAEALALDLGKSDFDELRRVVNTKWNLDIPEARAGIGGHCLPKDRHLAELYFNQYLTVKCSQFEKFIAQSYETNEKFMNKMVGDEG